MDSERQGLLFVELAVKGVGSSQLGSEYLCTTMLAAIKVIAAQRWPDPYRRDMEEAGRPGDVGISSHVSPCSKSRHPPPESCLAFPTTGYNRAMSITCVTMFPRKKDWVLY